MLTGVCTASQPGPAHVFASLEGLSVKAADGFIVQPAVLQAAAAGPSAHAAGQASVPASIGAVYVPTAATAIASASWSVRGADCALTSPRRPDAAACMQSIQHCELEPAFKAAAALDAAETLYQLEWQAAAVMPVLAGPQAAALAAFCRGSGSRQRLANLGLSQEASVAAADVVQLLHSHRSTPMTAVALHSAGGMPAQQQLSSAQPRVGAAAIAGVLKNLPFEMPFLTAQLLDTQPTGSDGNAGRPYGLSTAPLQSSLQADLYGVAARGGALHRPLLGYGAAADAPDGSGRQAAAVERDSTYVITGGLGGLGLLTAQWMAGGGAPALVLLSRSGVAASAGDARSITHSSTLMVVSKCDVSFSEDARLLASLARGQSWRFGGTVHTAGLQVSGLDYWVRSSCCALPPQSATDRSRTLTVLNTAAGGGAAAAADSAQHAPGSRPQAGRRAELPGSSTSEPSDLLAALLIGVIDCWIFGPCQLRSRQRSAGRLCTPAGDQRRAGRGCAVGRLDVCG